MAFGPGPRHGRGQSLPLRSRKLWICGPCAEFSAELAGWLDGPAVDRGLAVAMPALPPAPDSQDVVLYAMSPGRRGEPDLEHALALLAVLQERPPAHLLLLSSAAVYVPTPRHPGLAAESFQSADRTSNPIARAWRELEEAARDLQAAVPKVTILRPAILPRRRGRDFFSRLLAGRCAVVLPGYDPPLQFLSLSDLTRAIAVTLDRPGTGLRVYNLAPAGVIPLRRALKLAGATPLPVPRFLQAPFRKLASTVGRGRPFEQTEYLRYNWTVSGERMERELGVRPRDTSEAALRRAFELDTSPTQDLEFDDFGMDPAWIEARSRGLFQFLHDYYWRVEIRGLNNIPKQGAAVLVGMHRGFVPFDGIMMLYATARRHRRYIRFLVHPGLLKPPFTFNWIIRMGGVPAWRENAERILRREELLGIFPEGVEGAFAPYRRAYDLLKFDLQFVRLALRFQAPIIPFVTVGSAETFPILARIRSRWWRRRTSWPCFPLTPTFPLLPLPLPSKWHTWVLEPVKTKGRYPADSWRDSDLVKQLGAEVRKRMGDAVHWILQRRPSRFYGSVFG